MLKSTLAVAAILVIGLSIYAARPNTVGASEVASDLPSLDFGEVQGQDLIEARLSLGVLSAHERQVARCAADCICLELEVEQCADETFLNVSLRPSAIIGDHKHSYFVRYDDASYSHGNVTYSVRPRSRMNPGNVDVLIAGYGDGRWEATATLWVPRSSEVANLSLAKSDEAVAVSFGQRRASSNEMFDEIEFSLVGTSPTESSGSSSILGLIETSELEFLIQFESGLEETAQLSVHVAKTDFIQAVPPRLLFYSPGQQYLRVMLSEPDELECEPPPAGLEVATGPGGRVRVSWDGSPLDPGTEVRLRAGSLALRVPVVQPSSQAGPR